MDKVELIAVAIGAVVIVVAAIVVMVFPALGGDYRKGHDIGPGGPDS